MAAVTLQDLMNPLTKIQAATESSAESLDAITMAASTGVGQRNAQTDILRKIQVSLADRLGALIQATVDTDETGVGVGDVLLAKELKTQTKLLQLIAKGKGSKGKSEGKGKGKVSNSLKEGGEALQLLGAGTKDLAAGLALFKKVPKKAITKFNDLITGTFKKISEFKSSDLKAGAQSFEIISNSISKFAKALVVAALLLPIGIVGAKLLNVTIGILTPTFEALSEGGKKLKKGAEGFKLIADSIGTFAKNLVLATLLLPIGLVGLQLLKVAVNGLYSTFTDLGEDSKTIKKGAKALDLMGTSLLSFAKGLALAGLVAVVGIAAIPFLIVSLVLVGGAIMLLGKQSKSIRKGAKALDRVGDALKSFAVGLALFAITTFFIMMQPEILLGMVASIVLIGAAVGIIGLLNKQINKGSLSLALMGAGLAVFGVGYAIFSTFVASTAPTIGAVGIQLAVLGGIGLVTALLGAGLSLIAQGALSLVLMGAGLIIFGMGYTPFAEATKGATLESVGVQAGVLTALGLVFAAAGLAAIAIIPGAAAFGAIGLGLMALAPGLSAMKKVDFTEDDALKLTTTLAGVKMAFLGPPNKGGVISGIFKSIGGAISGGADAVAMTAAALGFAAAGKSLTALSKGLKDYQKLNWSDSESLTLAGTLSGITTAFAQAGGEPANPGGMFGVVFGSAFSPNATKRGVDSVMGAGKALTSIATGLTVFQKLVKSKIDFIGLSKDIAKVIGFVSEAFAAIGGEDQSVESGGFFSSLFGIKSTATEEGIRSVMDAGRALTGIAKGLEAFQGLKDPKTTASKIADALGFVSQAFAAIGTQDKVESGGFFSSLFGIKSTATEEGIRSVKGAGDELVKIGTALEKFQGIKDPKATASKISEALGFVSQAFAAIGTQEKVESGGFFSSLFGIKSTATEEGIRSVKGAGDELVKIGTALEKFAGLKNPKTTAKNIKQVLGMVGSAFASIGGQEQSDENWFMSWDENLVEKGIDAVDGAGAALTDIAAGLKAFSKDFDPVSVAKSVGTLLTSIGTAFSDLYATNPLISPQLKDFSSFIVTLGDVAEKGLLDKAADGISKIADSINKIDIDKTVAFGDLFKSSSQLSDDRSAYKALAKAVEDIRDMMAEPADSGPNFIEKGLNKLDGGTRGASPVEKSSTSNKGLERQLGKMAAAISSFPQEITSAMLGIPDGAFKVTKN